MYCHHVCERSRVQIADEPKVNFLGFSALYQKLFRASTMALAATLFIYYRSCLSITPLKLQQRRQRLLCGGSGSILVSGNRALINIKSKGHVLRALKLISREACSHRFKEAPSSNNARWFACEYRGYSKIAPKLFQVRLRVTLRRHLLELQLLKPHHL